MNNDKILEAQASATVTIQSPTNPPHRILVVDDDNSLRELNAEILTASGYQVDTAKDGAAGWKALQAKHYDLLVTDNNMPRVTGLELIKMLRSVDMTLSVILASGTVPTEELIQNPWLRLDVMLPKPFNTDQLLRAVKKVLRPEDDTVTVTVKNIESAS
jgi:two-component system, OmpR family, response regulator